MSILPASAVFEMDTPDSSAPADLLGIWHSPALNQLENLDTIVWRASLPRQNNQAHNLIQSNQNMLTLANMALPIAEQRIETNNTGGVLRGGQSFGLPWQIGDNILESAAEAERFFTALRIAFSPHARVETIVDERLIGLSVLSWTGELSSAVLPRISSQQALRHRQIISQVLISRQTAMRMGVLVAASAASLASGGITGPLALLAVFQFVRDLIAEVQKFGVNAMKLPDPN